MGTALRDRKRRNDRRRAGTTGFVLALSAALVFPGMASAEPGPDPLIVNDCDATLKGEAGKPVTLDVGAILQAPGVLTVGLGNESEGTNGNEEPLIVVPLTEGVDLLGLSDANLVKDVTGETCGVVKEAGNTTVMAVQEIVPGDDLVGDAPDGNDPEEPAEPEPVEPEPVEPEPGESDDTDDPVPGEEENVPGLTDAGSISEGLFGIGNEDLFIAAGSFQALGPLTVPPLAELPAVKAPVQAPDLNAPEAGKQPKVVAEDSGSAKAMPESNPPERLPLLLAVLGLVIVTALLARTWMRARTTT